MSRMRKLIIIKTVICVAVCAWFDFVINCCTTVERLRLTQQKCEGEKHPQSSKIKHSHIQIFTFEMLIVEWTTVTFRSASLLTNKYREGGVSSVKMRSTSPQWCLYTRKFSFGIRFAPTIKRK